MIANLCRAFLFSWLHWQAQRGDKNALVGPELSERLALLKLNVQTGMCTMPPAISSDIRIAGSKTLDAQVHIQLLFLLIKTRIVVQTTVTTDTYRNASAWRCTASSHHFFGLQCC